MRASEINAEPIGFVRTTAEKQELRGRQVVSEIVLDESLAEALEGIEEFSHLFVIFWMHKTTGEQRKLMKARPRERDDMPLLGIFATRSPCRPNPIGLTLVELLGRKGNILEVKGLDALDGTPVLDIKPFDFWDMKAEARVPKWWLTLEEERKSRDHSGGAEHKH